MAQPSKYVSVNLNKSYGQPSRSSPSTSGYGRPRAGAGSGSGGMVVLSRPRSSGSAAPKAGTKLSVPPPLNLPSLRKEHERFDPSSGPGGSSGAVGSGIGIGSSTMGWMKLSSFQEKDAGSVVPPHPAGASTYVPPGTRSQPAAASQPRAVEKAVVLRGEDFPSLHASFSSPHKQKDALSAKQKTKQPGDDQGVAAPRMGKSEPESPLYGRSQMRSFRPGSNIASDGDPIGGPKQQQKQDGLLAGPLPTIRLSHTSDWGDDERNTDLSIPGRDKERNHSRSDAFDDRDDFLRGDSVVSKEDRDYNFWRTTPQQRDGLSRRDATVGANRDAYGHQDNTRNGNSNGSQDGRYGRRDFFTGTNSQNGNEQTMRGRYGELSSSQFRRDGLQNNNAPSKGSYASISSKGLSLSGPAMEFGREKLLVSNGGKSYLESPGFDSGDPFVGDLIGDVNVKALKKKQDVSKQADFRDPARESFEAELERVQRIQDQERQRVLEEHARALELARKEEEERERAIREEEERRRQLEKEAREATLRAEQERLEAARRSEELKIAREEEKRRIILEEERRKDAARKKLLELEARIARRKAEASIEDSKIPLVTDDEQVSALVKERDVPQPLGARNWDDGDRIVERLAGSTPSDLLATNRYFDAGARPHGLRDVGSALLDRSKPSSSWKSDAYDVSTKFTLQDQRNDIRNAKTDGFGPGRGFPKEAHGPSGPIPAEPFYNGGAVESSQLRNDFRPSSADDWSIDPDGDHFNRNEGDVEFLENDKYGDDGKTHSPCGERLFPNSEADSLSFSRSRHSMRQPRVPPPPSTSSRSYMRAVAESSASSSFEDTEVGYHCAHDVEREPVSTLYAGRYQEQVREPRITNFSQENSHSLQQNETNMPKCDSQSSLSVSSPPSSPTLPSHDDLDEHVNSLDCQSIDSDDHTGLTASEQIVLSDDKNMMMSSTSVTCVLDDDWAIENNEAVQDQNEYAVKSDGYQEEDVHEGDDENLDLSQEFDDLQEDVQSTKATIEQMVFGYGEGIEDEIPSGGDLVGAGKVLIHDSPDDIQTENIHSSSIVLSKTEGLQDLVFDPALSAVTSPCNMEAPSSFGVSVSRSVTSSGFAMPTMLPIQPIISNASAVSSHIESPVKLQFGLFPGPNLLPSHVPSIQIGSIQMPLQLHPQVGPMTQMHPSQHSLFQFGQLKFTPSLPRTVMPPFVQPPASQFSLNQNNGGTLPGHVNRDSSARYHSGDKLSPVPLDKEPRRANKAPSLRQENLDYMEPNAFPDTFNDGLKFQNQVGNTSFENKAKLPSNLRTEQRFVRAVDVKKNYGQASSNKDSHTFIHTDAVLSRMTAGEKVVGRPRAHGIAAGIRGRRMMYAVRNTGSRPPYVDQESLNIRSDGFQRRTRRNVRKTEYRIRGNIDRRQSEGISLDYPMQDDDSNFHVEASSIFMKPGFKKDAVPNVPTKFMNEKEISDSASSTVQVVNSNDNMGNVLAKESEQNVPVSAIGAEEGYLKRSGRPEEDMDASLQSGVVRIFKQAGIETPSDEDDFIEVRSKRQMLNDRREQREKQIKAKSKVIKAPHRQRTVSQSNVASLSSSRFVAPSGGGATISGRIDSVATWGRGSNNVDPPHLFGSDATSQNLAPIGTSTSITDSVSRLDGLNSQINVSSVSSVGENLEHNSSVDAKATVPSITTEPFGSWIDADASHQVISLTQSQLDDAMKPALFDSSSANGLVLDSVDASTSIVRPEKTLSSESSPTSLLPVEKIQFGAVNSPIVIPPVSWSTSNKIVPSVRHSDVPRREDPEAEDEAEAAASAVAVAAISSSDEMLGNRSAATSVSIADGKNLVGGDVTGLSSRAVETTREVTGLSAGIEPLTVALPADLSVDTPLSLWPPILSPQSSSGSMLSHFPRSLNSHFPCLDVNHVLGAPIFAFGPHDESASSQAQPQRSTILGSGQPGAWTQCHSGVDSFYGPPAGFGGPFLNPGGIPGVQGPPHMVFYNHFAPVGQYSQVGLGFMGPTYIPTAKQPEWKHTVSSGPGVGESEVSNINSAPFRRNPPNIPPPIQHMPAGSPLVPMAPPVAMFDMSPFQSSAEIAMRARWPQMPASAPIHHAVPLNMLSPHQHQTEEGGVPAHFQRNVPADNPRNSAFNEPRLASPAGGSKSFSNMTDSASQFPDELVLGESSSGSGTTMQPGKPLNVPGSGSNMKGIGEAKSPPKSTEGLSIGISKGHNTIQAAQRLAPVSSGQHYLRPVGYAAAEQRSNAQQKMGSVGEWHRGLGFHGRNPGSGIEKGHQSKVKQIYVAKQQPVGGAANPT